MIEKQHLETFLKANGIKPTASDEEIRSLLISARWDHSEIDTALIILKENLLSHETHIDTLHKVFTTDNRLNAAEITALLGIQVALTVNDVSSSVTQTRQRVERGRIMLSFIFSVLIATFSIGYVLYHVHGPVLSKVIHVVNYTSPAMTTASTTHK